MISQRTLADISRNQRLFAHCDRMGCGRSKELDVEDLVRQHGADFRLDELRARVRCSSCGARPPEVRVQVIHNGRPD